ncbi:hypothetical protein [Limnoglobus roseus]|uniref:hypothetical protein n=1 Tax=Limnoglobus roseus TaxID=2598579 RepID=UPI0011EAF064|nr:hypothetical protein [Limnoglobus roseus]
MDYASIRFPSDRIDVAALRRAHPDRFDAEGGRRFADAGSDPTFFLDTIVYLERLLARSAFDHAAGRSANRQKGAGMSRSECLKDLTEFYQAYGVATGAKHTAQLVRGFEDQAAHQAGRRR